MTDGRNDHKEVAKEEDRKEVTGRKRYKPDPGRGGEGPEGSDAQTQRPQGTDKQGRTPKTRRNRKKRGAGPQGISAIEGDAPAEARIAGS